MVFGNLYERCQYDLLQIVQDDPALILHGYEKRFVNLRRDRAYQMPQEVLAGLKNIFLIEL